MLLWSYTRQERHSLGDRSSADVVLVGPHLQTCHPETTSHDHHSVSLTIPAAVPWTFPEPSICSIPEANDTQVEHSQPSVKCHPTPPCRVPFFAVLLSLMNRTNVTAVEAIVAEASRRLDDALIRRGGTAPGFGPSANMNVKTILRLYCSLSLLGVVSTSSLVAALRSVVDCAAQIARDADNEGDYRAWQPYSDFLVEAVVLALPWGEGALQENGGEAFDGLLDAIATYLGCRRHSVRHKRKAVLPEHSDLVGNSDLGPMLAGTCICGRGGVSAVPLRGHSPC